MPNWPSYSESVKVKIINIITSSPGLYGREIAERLGLHRPRVNSFLYGQGKRKYKLIEINYKWYPPNSFPQSETYQPKPRERASTQVKPNSIEPITSICKGLTRMGQSQAILSIRSMTSEKIDLAFREEDYQLLSDVLQGEMAVRHVQLENQSTTSKKEFHLASFLIGGICFIALIKGWWLLIAFIGIAFWLYQKNK